MYPSAKKDGVVRTVRLKYVNAMFNEIADQSCDGQCTTIADLVQTLQEAGSSSNILDQEAFHMARYKAKYWAPHEQRLKAFKEVFGDDTIVRAHVIFTLSSFPRGFLYWQTRACKTCFQFLSWSVNHQFNHACGS